MAAKVTEPYQNLSREELLDKAHELGAAYEQNSYSCSQCTVAALHRILGFPDILVKAACSNAAGTAWQLMGTCSGLVGGILVLGGIGMTWENDIHLYLKRAKTNELILGAPVYHREWVARLLMAEKGI